MRKLLSILLIEDDAICSWFNKVLLEEMQIAQSIHCVSTGQEALQYLKENHSTQPEAEHPLPNLIFMDLNLPDMNGFALLDQLKKLIPESALLTDRTILLTNSMQANDLEKAHEYKIFRYLVKPLTETKIKNIVADTVRPAARKKGKRIA